MKYKSPLIQNTLLLVFSSLDSSSMPVIRGWFSPIWESQHSVRRRLTNYNEGQVNIDRRRLKATELTLMQTWIRKIQHGGLISSFFYRLYQTDSIIPHMTYPVAVFGVWFQQLFVFFELWENQMILHDNTLSLMRWRAENSWHAYAITYWTPHPIIARM